MLGTLAGRNPLVVSLATLPREGSVRTATIVTAIQATTIRNRKRTLATPIRAKTRFMPPSRGTAIGRGQKGSFAPAANRPPLRRGRLRGASHRQRYRRRFARNRLAGGESLPAHLGLAPSRYLPVSASTPDRGRVRPRSWVVVDDRPGCIGGRIHAVRAERVLRLPGSDHEPLDTAAGIQVDGLGPSALGILGYENAEAGKAVVPALRSVEAHRESVGVGRPGAQRRHAPQSEDVAAQLIPLRVGGPTRIHGLDESAAGEVDGSIVVGAAEDLRGCALEAVLHDGV